MTAVATNTRVIVVDDDPIVANTVGSILERAGYAVEKFTSSHAAQQRIAAGPIDVIVSDVMMPNMNGIELLERLREKNVEVPVIFMTGAPRLADTIRAMELRAFRYIAKPFERETLLRAVSEAVSWSRLTRAASESDYYRDRQMLESLFERTLQTLAVHYQPIVGTTSGRVFGFEALMRSQVAELRSPPAVIDAAEKLGRLHTLGRHVRKIVSDHIAANRSEATFFVNLHSADLADPQLYSPDSPLSRFASGVVLELTERASLEGIEDVEKRLAQLRSLGYRIAVDDLGAGYAGLSYFTQVKPDIVKIDMSLTRAIDSNAVKQRVVSSICGLAKELAIIVVAEGIETMDEYRCVARYGADLVQGYLIGKPQPTALDFCVPSALVPAS
ncbi:MAG: EAL domain-containing protein [Polyangiales bacterium]